MQLKKMRCFEAALLAALSLVLSACGTGDRPEDAAPTAGSPASSSQGAESETPSEEIPSYSTAPTPSDSPSQSEEPLQSQSDEPLPSQGEEPSPVQSVSPSPTQGESSPPIHSQTLSGAMPEGEDVGNDWFANAVFVGDSRTDGLRLYSGIKGATFICHTGLSVFTVGKNACIKSDEGKITAMEALARQQYAKVYLMLGVNELGYSAESFQRAYTKVVEEIKTLQPGAVIYLQTLIPVNEPIAYSNGTSQAINNEKLRQFNQIIAAIAQYENVCLVDVDTPFWSAEGCLAAENTGDGVHLTRAGYQTWFAYLRTHTGGVSSSTVFVPGAGVDSGNNTPNPEGDDLPSYTPPGGFQPDNIQPDLNIA